MYIKKTITVMLKGSKMSVAGDISKERHEAEFTIQDLYAELHKRLEGGQFFGILVGGKARLFNTDSIECVELDIIEIDKATYEQ